jgi:DedD protein
MDSRAKQRLTGAVILVALFVLLVPELLTGPKDSANMPATEADGMRRYTIDLEAPPPANGQAPQPAVALPPLAESPTTGASERAQPGESAMPAGEMPSAVETPNPRIASPAVPPATSAAPAQAGARPAPGASAPSTAASTPVPAAAQTAPAAETRKPSAAGAEPRSFVIQLGSFGSKENADRLVRDMTARGFAAFIAPITTHGRELYRVRVGPTRDRASAEALAAQLKRSGQSGSIVPIP